MSLDGLIARRRRARQGVVDAENVIETIDKEMRAAAQLGHEIPIEATPAMLELTSTHAITLNTVWVGEALQFAHHRGYRECRKTWQPFMDYVNANPDWRTALDERVTDPQLRAILNTALERM